jgi:multiple sugar transport system substrate-binding protein
MRIGTIIWIALLLGAAAGLGVSIRRASTPRTVDGVRVYTLLVWGAAEEIGELEGRVVAPVNRAMARLGARVRAVAVPKDYPTKLRTMIAGGSPPELFYLSQTDVPAFAAQGVLADLTDRVAQDASPSTDLERYYPEVLDLYRLDGRLVGLPWIAQPVVLYCNRTLFREANVPLPDRSWGRARFVRAARRLTRDTDGDGEIDRWGFIVTPGWPPHHMWIWQNGAAMLTPEGRWALDDPRAAAALDDYAGLVHDDRVAPPLSIVTARGFADLFRAGRVAMFMGGAADDLDRLPGLDVVVAEVPAGPGGRRATFAWTAGLHMSPPAAADPVAFEAYVRLLDRIQRWKIPAPRRDLAGIIGRVEPRKARAAEVIRRSMEYMRPPRVIEHQVRWQTIFDEEVIQPLLRNPDARAAERLDQARLRLEGLL